MKQKEIKKIVSTLRTSTKRIMSTHNTFVVGGENTYVVLKNKKNPHFFVLHKPGKKDKQQVGVDYVHNIVFYLDRNMDGNQCIVGRKAHATQPGIVYAPYVLADAVIINKPDYDMTVPRKDVPTRYLEPVSGEVHYCDFVIHTDE